MVWDVLPCINDLWLSVFHCFCSWFQYNVHEHYRSVYDREREYHSVGRGSRLLINYSPKCTVTVLSELITPSIVYYVSID